LNRRSNEAMSENNIDEFEDVLKGMIGLACWSVQVSGVGSLLNLHFGERVRRSQPLTMPDFKLTPEERAFQGSHVLYLEDCPWRVESDEAVLATWLDSSEPEGELTLAVQQLHEQRVAAVELQRPGLDLMVRFDNNLRLRVFPDQVDADMGDNYALALALPDRMYVVAARSTLYVDEA
jgi:hypothetical protein